MHSMIVRVGVGVVDESVVVAMEMLRKEFKAKDKKKPKVTSNQSNRLKQNETTEQLTK